jgi:hypothetical protein
MVLKKIVNFLDPIMAVVRNKASGLNHRFFLHYNNRGRMWLCAEDGCEGTPSEGGRGLMGKIGEMLFGSEEKGKVLQNSIGCLP